MVFRLILHPIYLRGNTFFGLPLQLAKTSIKLLQKKNTIIRNTYGNWSLISWRLLISNCSVQSQPFRGVLIKRCSENMLETYRRTPMPKCDFNKVAKELYWNLTSTWAFSCKYAAYFQNTFSSEHLWRAASVGMYQHNFPAITVSVTRCFNSNWISFQSFTLVRIFLYWDWIRRFTP